MGWPLGTPDELRNAGMNPATSPCCAPESGMQGPLGQAQGGHDVAAGGCSAYGQCLFALKRYGGFRDQGPRNVAVLQQVDPTEIAANADRPASNVNIMPCFLFMANLFQRWKQQNESREVIAIVAQEGEKTEYIDERMVPDPRGAEFPKKREYFLNEEFIVPKFKRINEDNPRLDLVKRMAAKHLEHMEADDTARAKQALEQMAGDARKKHG